MCKRKGWKRYSSHDIHERLYASTAACRDKHDAPIADDGWVAAQALFCPYYVPLEGKLGFDWGVVVSPESVKFGLLVFEHDWCGCPGEPSSEPGDAGTFRTFHKQGDQATDEWVDAKADRRHIKTLLATIPESSNG